MNECSVSHHAQDGETTYNLHFTTQGLLQIVYKIISTKYNLWYYVCLQIFNCFYIAHYVQYKFKVVYVLQVFWCNIKPWGENNNQTKLNNNLTIYIYFFKLKKIYSVSSLFIGRCVLNKHVQNACSHFTPDWYSMMHMLLIIMTLNWNSIK